MSIGAFFDCHWGLTRSLAVTFEYHPGLDAVWRGLGG